MSVKPVGIPCLHAGEDVNAQRRAQRFVIRHGLMDQLKKEDAEGKR